MKKFLALVGLGSIVGAASSFAVDETVDTIATSVDVITTKANSLFSSIVTLTLAIVGLGILLFIVRKIRGR